MTGYNTQFSLRFENAMNTRRMLMIVELELQKKSHN